MRSKKNLSNSLNAGTDFVVVAELAAGPGGNFGPIRKFLTEADKAGPDTLPKGFDFVGMTVPQNPGGLANLEPSDVLCRVTDTNLLGNLDFIPHISCKDHNVDAIKSSLTHYKQRQITSILALTGDKPVSARGVFEIESVGLLQLIERMNHEAYLKAKPEQRDGTVQFFPGAAVSPFKYTEASQMQQYYKMQKKIVCGARFLITQVGWDWKKSSELMRYLNENALDIPVLGNVYLLSTATPAPRLMHDGKLPGCFVSDGFYAHLQSEQVEQHIERAAQQVAMYKELGAAGVDVGGLPDFATFTRILNRANQIGADWEKYKDNLCWPGGDGFYLYEGAGQKAASTKMKKKFRQKTFDLVHRAILDSDHAGFKLFRGSMALLGTKKGKGFFYKSFFAAERSLKYLMFDCQDCGDCYLPENFGYCTIGGCEKGLSNAPCGDSTVDGLCGNNLERVCIGDLIYKAAAAKTNGRDILRNTLNRPRMHALENTSAILNYLFAEDHTQSSPLISIGEMLNASSPVMGSIMKEYPASPEQTKDLGERFGYLKALIQTQANEGASYIAINIDALAHGDEQQAVRLIQSYVELIRRLGKGVPVCIDSKYEKALIAGLKTWYATRDPIAPPLVGPIRISSADSLLALKKQYDFSIVSTLSNNHSEDELNQHNIEESCDLARQLFRKAVSQYHFRPDQVYLDPVAVPLASDVLESKGTATQTHKTFRIIQSIKRDSAMKKSHCLLRISHTTRGISRRKVGVARAYVAKAMEHGMDAAFVDVARHYGQGSADPALLKLIDAYAEVGNSTQETEDAKDQMRRLCAGAKKNPRKF